MKKVKKLVMVMLLIIGSFSLIGCFSTTKGNLVKEDVEKLRLYRNLKDYLSIGILESYEDIKLNIDNDDYIY